MSHFVLTRIFKDHRWLWIADSYSRHEQQQEDYKTNPFGAYSDRESVHAERFRFLLPMVLSDDALNVDYLSQHDKLLERLVEIETTYNVFKRSIDFDVLLGNSMKRVLAKPRKAGPRRDLLSPEQFAHVASVISSVEEWEGDGPAHAGTLSFWETLYQAQREINEVGQVSEESRAALERLNKMKPKKQKLYARQIVFILLAEFFDDFSDEKWETNISDCSIEAEWDPYTFKKIGAERTYFNSPFARFVTGFYVLARVEGEFDPNDKRMVAVQGEAWLRDKWHEKLGFERGVNLRRKSRPSTRITEKLTSRSDINDIMDVLAILDDMKPRK